MTFRSAARKNGKRNRTGIRVYLKRISGLLSGTGPWDDDGDDVGRISKHVWIVLDAGKRGPSMKALNAGCAAYRLGQRGHRCSVGQLAQFGCKAHASRVCLDWPYRYMLGSWNAHGLFEVRIVTDELLLKWKLKIREVFKSERN